MSLKKKNFLGFEASFKNVAVVPMDIKAVDDEGNEIVKQQDFLTFEGYASTFGNKDLVGDIVQKGAFKKSIKDRMPIMLLQHNAWEAPIGGIKSIEEDDHGLYIKAALPMDDTRVSGQIAPQMRAGNFNKMSIGYNTIVSERDEKTGVRTLKQIDLHEISLVTMPANPEASVTSVKTEFGIDDVESIKTKAEFEDLLKSSGAFSRKACTFLASLVQFKTQSDSVVDDKEKEQRDSVQKAIDQMSGLFDTIKQSTMR